MQNLWITPEELPSEYASSSFSFEACASASLILWGLSGRKYNGVTTVTETYETAEYSVCESPTDARYRELVMLETRPISARRLRLRGGPVIEVLQVLQRGEIVSPDKYRLINRSMIQPLSEHLLDGCQVTVTYTYGARPPLLGRRAAAELAAEFVKDWDPDQSNCRLPDRVSSVSRQGVSYTILDDQSYLNDLRTGLYSIDLFLRATNPFKATRRARVFSPDLPRVSRVTGARAKQPAGPNDVVISESGATVWSRSLADVNGAVLAAQEAWRPIVQVTGAHGAILLEVPESQVAVDISTGTITVTLNSYETDPIRDTAVLSVYAEGAGSLAHLTSVSVVR